jgi:hypothetical protein
MISRALKGIIFSVLVTYFGIHQISATNEPLDPADGKGYCYQSLKSLSEDTPAGANCLQISNDGLVSRIFEGEPKIKGYVYPGLWDGHGHILQYGELLQSVNLFGSVSLQDALHRVKDYATEHPSTGSKDQWIRGVGWDQATFGRMPAAVGVSCVCSL